VPIKTQIKDRQQFLTILTLAVVALFAIDKIIVPPLQNFWHKRAVRIKTLQDEVKDGKWWLGRKDWAHSQWAKIQSSALTNNMTLAQQQFFAGLNHWSQSSGIEVGTITPEWKQGTDASYKTLDCRVEASGSLDRLTQFLYDLERDPMALKLQSVELTSRDNNGTSIAMGVQISGLVLTANSKDQK